jgi:hypothetical protein
MLSFTHNGRYVEAHIDAWEIPAGCLSRYERSSYRSDVIKISRGVLCKSQFICCSLLSVKYERSFEITSDYEQSQLRNDFELFYL